jgi:beta-galactosidase GanA
VALTSAAFAQPPALVRHGKATQLVVDGKPYLIFGGELSNSAASSPAYMAPVWSKLQQMDLNTVLAPVSWQLIEPQEGHFDFSTVDSLLDGARAHHLHLVLLWFGAWKNSMSSYVPSWVKRDERRFPRAELPNGSGEEILSAFSPNVLAADSRAFAALMAHLRTIDSANRTVLLVQVENEIGMLPTARDHSPAANEAYAAPVPPALTRYLTSHRDSLIPTLRQRWEANGSRMAGTWEQVFGTGTSTEEIFTAWYYARYADAVARSGKREYDLPMYVNVALNRPGKAPGEYPSGGPLPHLIDIWKAAAPALDMLSPDIYFSNFTGTVADYDRPDNPVFIPEQGRTTVDELIANAFFAFGEHKAIGYSPFDIDDFDGDRASTLNQAYGILDALTPMILRAQSAGTIGAAKPAVAYNGAVDDKPQQITLGSYRFTIGFIDPWTPRDQQHPEDHVAMLIQTGPEDYWVAGRGAVLTFEPVGAGPPIAGIEVDWEQKLDGHTWSDLRLLNGDETNQGRHIRLPPGEFTVQRFRLYRYR